MKYRRSLSVDEDFAKNLKEWKFRPASRPDGAPVYAINRSGNEDQLK
jgi:hypothetical protein